MNTPSKSHQFYTQTALKRNSPKRSPLCSYLWTSPILYMLLKTKSTNASEKCVLSMSNNHYIFLKCSVHAALYWKHRLCMQRKQSIPNYITFSCFGLRRFIIPNERNKNFKEGKLNPLFWEVFLASTACCTAAQSWAWVRSSAQVFWGTEYICKFILKNSSMTSGLN